MSKVLVYVLSIAVLITKDIKKKILHFSLLNNGWASGISGIGLAFGVSTGSTDTEYVEFVSEIKIYYGVSLVRIDKNLQRICY